MVSREASGRRQAARRASATANRVVATSDDYSNSLIVSAAPDLMATIEDMVEQIDVPTSDVTELRVFHLLKRRPRRSWPTRLPSSFPMTPASCGNTRAAISASASSAARFGSKPRQQPASDRLKKKTQVLAVPDPRTSSLMVSAAGELMPQLAEMIAQLDASAAKKEKVAGLRPENANPQDVNQVLQDLFNRNNTIGPITTTPQLDARANNPLSQRATQQQNNNSRMSISAIITGFGRRILINSAKTFIHDKHH